jgi:hypothetical protein
MTAPSLLTAVRPVVQVTAKRNKNVEPVNFASRMPGHPISQAVDNKMLASRSGRMKPYFAKYHNILP